MKCITSILLLAITACGGCGGGGGVATPVSSFPHNIEVGPHLTQLDVDAATITWRTHEQEVAGLECNDEVGPHAVLAGSFPALEHTFRIDGLAPDTVYQYRLVQNGQVRPELYEFRTPKAPDAVFVFGVVGDSGSGLGAQFDVIDQMERADLEFVLTTGDNAYEKGARHEVIARYFVPFADLMARIPFFPSLGNHDVMTDNGAPFLELAQPARYYAVRRGNLLALALDSNIDMGPGSAQHDWLVSQLAGTDADWKILYFHHPPYAAGGHGSDLGVRSAIGPTLDAYGIDLVFSGHNHNYERSIPVRNGEADPDGTVFVVTGGGGKRLYDTGTSWFTAYTESIHHFVRVTVDGLRLSLEARASDGRVIDSFTISKG